MITVRFRFPGGRYHATPWGCHVNEGLVEWPPSPWRLLRALIATGYSKLGWRENVPPEARELINDLAQTLPRYGLPEAAGAHSRHYMPIRSGKSEKTTLVFDSWLNIGRNYPITVHWNCNSNADAPLVKSLFEKMSYLGRSESWVQAKVLSAAEAESRPPPNAYPCGEEEHPGRDWEQIALVAPQLPEVYEKWQGKEAAKALEPFPVPDADKKMSKKLEKDRQKAVAPFPVDLIDCLQKDTSWWKGYKWSSPPGSRRVFYWRNPNSIRLAVPVIRAMPEKRPSVRTVLLALTPEGGNRSILPMASRSLPQGEMLHRKIVRLAGKKCTEDNWEKLSVLTGQDEEGHPLREGHSHAHVIHLDIDGDGRLDHVLIYAPGGLSGMAQDVVRGLYRTWAKKVQGDIRLAVAGLGEVSDMRRFPARIGERLQAVCGRGTEWVSKTPFVAPRYLKRNGKNSLEGQVKAELASRGLPEALVEPINPKDELSRRLRHYVIQRRNSMAPPQNYGFALRLSFSKQVEGPICLGYASHFGLGVFELMPGC